MYISININLEPIITDELAAYIKAVLPGELNEALFQDKKYLNKVIQEAVKGQIKATIAELLQGKDYRNFLRNKIAKEIGFSED